MRSQSGSTSQATLPPIAPRPSPPIPPNSSMQAPPTTVQKSSAELYGLFGYSFDGQTYGQNCSENDLTSSTPSHLQHQQSSFDNDLVSPKTGSISKNRLGSMQQPKLQHTSTSESDSGIDVTFNEYSSHSSASSSGPPINPFHLQNQEINSSSFDQPHRSSMDHPLDALFPPNIDQILPEQYRNADQSYHSKGSWAPHPTDRSQPPFAMFDCHVQPSPISPTKYADSNPSGHLSGGKIPFSTRRSGGLSRYLTSNSRARAV